MYAGLLGTLHNQCCRVWEITTCSSATAGMLRDQDAENGCPCMLVVIVHTGLHDLTFCATCLPSRSYLLDLHYI